MRLRGRSRGRKTWIGGLARFGVRRAIFRRRLYPIFAKRLLGKRRR